MARKTINIGSAANDGTGDPLRTAFGKVNENFATVCDDLVPTGTEILWPMSETLPGGLWADTGLRLLSGTSERAILSRLFDVSILFASGEQGVWLDPSDGATMFQDTAGTAPAGAGDAVALMLDKSQGLVLGPELVTNGTFDSDASGWTADRATLSVVSGAIRVADDGQWSKAYQGVTTTVGKTYAVSLDLLGASGLSTGRFGVSDQQPPTDSYGSDLFGRDPAPGTYTWYFTATASTTYVIVGSEESDYADYDNISVRELKGNHATQATAAARPIRNTAGNGLTFDGVDDYINVEIPTGGLIGTLYYASSVGKGAFGVDYAAGTQGFGNVNFAEWDKDIYALVAVDRTLTSAEIAHLDAKYSMAGDFDTLAPGNRMFTSNSLTSLPADMTLPLLASAVQMFQNNSLTSLPEDMTLDNLTSGGSMFRNNNLESLPANMTLPLLDDAFLMFDGNGITSLPNGMTLPALTIGNRMFKDNTPLTTVPSDFAEDSDCINWDKVFTGTNLTQQSIDNILTNLDARGTSNGTFDQSGGSAPSATGEAAIDALRGRGWTITVTGAY